MACKFFRSGFSLVEVMMFLLIASLIVAASVPIVTKKHFKLPQVVAHGAYLCSYVEQADGSLKLHETRWTGKYVLKKVLDRNVPECKFVVPDKAPFFQISAIGGGGGGGDAGYNGGAYTSGISAEQKLGPFNLTEEYLNQHGIALSEFNSYKGSLYGYARGGGSGDGGDIGYVKATLKSDCEDREVVKTEICLQPASGDSTSCYCKGADGNKTGSPCSNTSTGTVPESCENTFEIEGAPKTCPKSDCIAWDKYNCKQKELTKEVCTYGYHDEYYYTYDSVNGTRGETASPSHGDQSTGTRITGGPYKKSVKNSTPDCIEVGTGVFEEECDIKCTKTKDYVVDCSTYKENTVCVPASTVTVDNITNTCSACTNGTVCESTSSSGEPPCLKKGYTQKLECVKDEYGNDKKIYWYTYSHTLERGLPGGSGIACVSQPISGGLRLTGSGVSNAYDASMSKGASFDLPTLASSPEGCFNSSRVAEQGFAPCVDSAGNGIKLHACTDANPASSASYTITSPAGSSVSVLATSAKAGGAGASRGLCTEDDGHSDAILPVASTAIDATCTTGIPGTPCGSGWNGYCLIHYGGTTEANGAYRWKYTYDNNYLTYGAAGEPGELKTAIVRSLKGVDTTISLGQGGAAADLNNGGNGGEGGETRFGLNGSILRAKGGKGGEGKLQSPIDTLLEPYDPSKSIDQQITKEYTGQAGTKANAVGLASKIMNLIVDNNDGSDATNIFMQKGIGGQGGGVKHKCWVGQRVYYFEGQELSTYSVKPSDIPASCKTHYENIPAKKGNPGALLIKW